MGPNASGRLWGNLMLLAARDYQVTLKLVMVWPNGLWSNNLGIDSAKEICDWAHNKQGSLLHVEVIDADWWGLCKIPSVGAILVRPDDHVAWVSHSESNSDSINDLHNVFAAVLCC